MTSLCQRVSEKRKVAHLLSLLAFIQSRLKIVVPDADTVPTPD